MPERSLPKPPNGRMDYPPVDFHPIVPGQRLRCRHHGVPSRPELADRRKQKTAIGRSSDSQGFQGSCTRQDVPKTSHKLTNNRTVIVSSAQGFVQCRMGGRGLPVRRPCGALERYPTQSADGRERAGPLRIDSLFREVYVSCEGFRSGQSTECGASKADLRRGCSREASNRARNLSIGTRRTREGCAGATP